MSLYIAGFIVALVLALLVIVWIAFWLFVREKHKSEFYHHNIADIQRRNNILNMQLDAPSEKKSDKKDISIAVFALPSRHKQKQEDYGKRPDYPESSLQSHRSTHKLIDTDDGDFTSSDYKDGIYEVDGPTTNDSEV